jgi:hypothetical protein
MGDALCVWAVHIGKVVISISQASNREPRLCWVHYGHDTPACR